MTDNAKDDSLAPTGSLNPSNSSSDDLSSLKGLTMALGIEPAQPGHDPMLGVDIGGVTILRLIAEGGMGRVYEGRQEKPGRTVAVKVMRPGLASPSLLKRFEYETEVLGRLQHPGIAQIYAVGIHRIGNTTVPYFIMEYIAEAKSLTAYAEELKLPTRQRLDLFRSVCEAVAHGHHRGVIHRDLKPSNILVDTSGLPKVIDFGVARATDSDMALTTMQTDVGQLIGTLQYMSPEQFDANPNDIDIRSDVYALGVILYELLTGKPPYDVKKKAVLEVMRMVKEEDPTPISRLNRALRGDVAVIAGKCLAKERGNRYSSAGEVGADIGRYLSGDAIAAIPPGFWDGVVRLAKKHRLATAAVVGISASLVAAITGVTAFAIKAERARVVATVAQAAEKRQRLVAENAQHVAEAATKKTQMHLYAAKSYAFSTFLNASQRRSNATAIYRDLESTYRTAYREADKEPIEFRIYKALLDTSSATLSGEGGNFSLLAFACDGARLVTTSGGNRARIWDSLTGVLKAELTGHEGGIRSLAVSPDGAVLATAATDGTTRLWDSKTGKCIASLQGEVCKDTRMSWKTTALTFSPDGKYLATAAAGKTVRVWDLTKGGEHAVFEGHRDQVLSVAFSPDSSRLVTSASDESTRLWNVEDKRLVSEFSAPDRVKHDVFYRPLFSPNGELIATWCLFKRRIWDGATGALIVAFPGDNGAGGAFSHDGQRLLGPKHIWDARKGTLIAELKGHMGPVNCFCLSPDGKSLATGGEDATVRVWSSGTGEQLAVLRGHSNWITALSFSRDGRFIGSGSDDGTARIWSAYTGELVTVIKGHNSRVIRVEQSPNGTAWVTSSIDGTVRLWQGDAATPLYILKGHQQDIVGLRFSPDGARLITSSKDRTIRLWDTATGEVVGLKKGTGDHMSPVAFGANGTRFAGAMGYNGYVWDAYTGATAAILRGHKGNLRSIVFSPRGERVVTASHDGTARIWDARSGKSIAVLSGHRDQSGAPADEAEVRTLAFSPDGAHLLTASKDGGARLWNASSGELINAIDGKKTGRVDIVFFSHDGKTIFMATDKRTIVAMAVPLGESVCIYGGMTSYVCDVSLSSDGHRIAASAGDGTACIWDALTGKTIATLKGHGDRAYRIRFSNDNTRLFTVGADGTVRIWDAKSGEPLAVLEGHGSSIDCLAVSPDDTLLATGASDGTVRLWGLSNQKMCRNRQDADARRERLGPLVATWFESGVDEVEAHLNAAKGTMSSEDFREAANLVSLKVMGQKAQ
jgi:WD40 repeat protein